MKISQPQLSLLAGECSLVLFRGKRITFYPCHNGSNSHTQQKRRHNIGWKLIITSKFDSVSTTEKTKEVDDIFYELKEKHTGKYETPKLKLWSCMIASGLHADWDISAFTGSVCKKGKTDGGHHSINEALTGVAIAFAKAVNVEIILWQWELHVTKIIR